MTTPNLFPPDVLQEIRDLQQAVRQLQAAVGRQTPLASASAGWLLPNMAIPANPDSGVHIGGNGNDFFALTPSGEVKRIPGTGGAVADATNNLALAPATYNKAHLDQCINSLDTLFTTVGQLVPILRSGNFPSP